LLRVLRRGRKAWRSRPIRRCFRLALGIQWRRFRHYEASAKGSDSAADAAHRSAGWRCWLLNPRPWSARVAVTRPVRLTPRERALIHCPACIFARLGIATTMIRFTATIYPPKRRSARRSPSTRKRWARTRPRSAVRRAIVARRRHGGYRADRCRPEERAQSSTAAGRSAIVKLFHFGRFDMASCSTPSESWPRRLLHQDRLEDRADYTTGTVQGPDARVAERRDLQAAAIIRLGRGDANEAQLAYAASDVLHLHALRDKLDAMLKREGRDGLARAAFAYLPDRVRLDLAGLSDGRFFARLSLRPSLRRSRYAISGACCDRAFCIATRFRIPPRASASIRISSSSENGAPSADPELRPGSSRS